MAGRYGFSRASLDGRRVGAEAEAELGGLALTQPVGVPAGGKATISYQLIRRGAAERLDDGRMRYRVVLRPRPPSGPTRPGWWWRRPAAGRSSGCPAGARPSGAGGTWSGTVDRERELVFELKRT